MIDAVWPYTMLTQLNDTNFYPTLQMLAGPVLIIFSSAGCNSCRLWRELLTQLSTQDQVRVFEVDAGHSMGLAREYEIFHLPALFVFRDGQYHAPLNCAANLATLRDKLTEVLAQPAREAP